MSNVDTSKTYWDNEGKYQEQYTKACEKLIPFHGEAEDGLPEALRAIARVNYDYYNNGFCNLWHTWDDGDTTMNPYYEDMVDYLGANLPFDLFQDLKWFLQDAKGYGNWSDQAGVLDRIIDYLMEQIIEEELIPQANA